MQGTKIRDIPVPRIPELILTFFPEGVKWKPDVFPELFPKNLFSAPIKLTFPRFSSIIDELYYIGVIWPHWRNLFIMDPDTANPFPDTGTALLLFCFFLALGGFVVLCQNSLIELSDQKLKRSEGGPPSPLERAARLLERPGRFSSAMRGAYTFCHLCAVAFLARAAEVSALFSAPFWRTPGGRLLQSFLVTLAGVAFIMVFSRGVPRRLAARCAEKAAPILSGPAAVIVALFTPLAWFVEKAVSLVLLLFGIHGQDLPENVTEEEIRMMVDVSEETGGIEAAEKEMILGVFDFADRTVDEIMTHRTDVTAVPEDIGLEELVALAAEHGFSRIPVVGEDGLDDILGILNVKDLLPLAVADRRRKFTVKSYLRPPFYVPESTKCRDLFARLNQQKTQIAVVVDEYGGTSGIVTMEDLLESIVGDIQDEYDNEEAEATAISQNRYTLDGDIDLAEVARLLDCSFAEREDWDDYDTLGGLLIAMLDRIPGPKEHPSVEVDGVRFTVQKCNGRQILEVLAEKIRDGEKEE